MRSKGQQTGAPGGPCYTRICSSSVHLNTDHAAHAQGLGLNIWVVIPTYNEAENLALMVDALLDLRIPDWSTSEVASIDEVPLATISILVVDDNSPDGTGQLADELSRKKRGAVQVLHRSGKLGLGTAYVAGFDYALEQGSDVVIEMDADFSHSPAYVPIMVGLLRDHDVVVGSRWVRGGRLDESWERWRYLLSKYANVYARLVTHLDVFDTTAGFKAFRGEALRRLPLHRIRSDGYAFQIEVATWCKRLGLSVVELPIYFEERARGASKMSFRIILEAMWRVWQIRFR